MGPHHNPLQTDSHHSILGGYLLGVPDLLLLLLSPFPYLSVLTNIVAMDRVHIHFPVLRASPSHPPLRGCKDQNTKSARLCTALTDVEMASPDACFARAHQNGLAQLGTRDLWSEETEVTSPDPPPCCKPTHNLTEDPDLQPNLSSTSLKVLPHRNRNHSNYKTGTNRSYYSSKRVQSVGMQKSERR